MKKIYDVDVIAGKGQQLTGKVCIPDRGDEVTEDSIIVIPNGSDTYHVHGMKCKAIVTEIGNRLCHLAIVTREQKKVLVKLDNAIELLSGVDKAWIRCPDHNNKGVLAEVK